MDFRVLGPFDVLSDQGVSVSLGGTRQRAVLAALIAQAGEVRSVDQIVDAVWGDEIPANPKGAVQVAVSRLRKALGANRLESRGPGYVLRIEPDELDADVFELLVIEARHAADAGQHALAVERLDEALALWRGDPYADFAYSDFAQPQILKLRTLRDSAREARFDARIAVGEHDAVLPEIEAQLAADPLREGLWAAYMLALYRAGRQAEALRAYQDAAKTLGEELGIEPGTDLRALEESILLQSPDLDRIAESSPVDLPEGEVAFLVADAGLATERDPEEARSVLDSLDTAVASHGGHVFRATADQRFAVFTSADAAARCSIDLAIDRSASLPAVAIHVSPARVRRGDYVGLGISRAARVGVVGMPGEVLITETALEQLAPRLEPPAEVVRLDPRVLPGTSAPETLWRLTHPALPAVLEEAAPLEGNLPATELSSFVGRVAELADVRDLMDEARLVTLTGPGGVGKTRLALQAASDRVGRQSGGVWLLELAQLTDAAQLATKLAAILGLEVEAGIDAEQVVIDRLRERPALLFIDNCEHLVDGVADLVTVILESSPASAVLATSRERLGVPGEVVYQVPSLAVPDAAAEATEVLEFEAVQLFETRATDLLGDFEVTSENAAAVATLCRRLDGIPLALELAAGRLDVLSPTEMVERLDERFSLLTSSRRRGRRETLRDTIEWSYSLLGDAERHLLAALAVFHGPFDLPAVEAVCFAGQDAHTAIDTVAALVAKSLVSAKRRPGRPTVYELLETIAAFAGEKLRESGEVERLTAAHGQYFCDLALQESERLFGPEAAAALQRAVDHMPDIRAAFEWAAGAEEARSLELLSEINQLWLSAGLAREGVGWAARLLDTFGHTSSVDLGRGLKTAGALALHARDFEQAREWLDRAVAMGEELGDELGVAMALTNLAVLDAEEGDLERAADGYVRALDALPSDADPSLRTIAVGNVGAGLVDLGRFDEALPYLEQQLEMAIDIESPILQSRVLTNIGLCELMRGDLSVAEQSMRRALSLAADIDSVTAAQTETWLACVELLQDRVADAAAHLSDAIELSREVYPTNLRLCLLIAMAVAVARQDNAPAVRLFGAAQSFSEEPMGSVEIVKLQPFYEEAVGALEDPEEQLAAGRALAADEAIAEAIALLRKP